MNLAQMKRSHHEVEARNLELVMSGFDRWQKGTGSVFDLLSPTAKWTIVGSSDVSGTYGSKQEFMTSVIQPFNARLSRPLVPGLRGLYADDDMVIALFDAEGGAKDGRPYRNTYSWYMRMHRDRIVEVVAFFDSVEFNDLWRRVNP